MPPIDHPAATKTEVLPSVTPGRSRGGVPSSTPWITGTTRILEHAADLEAIMLTVAHGALQAIPGARHASLTVSDSTASFAPGGFSTASDESARAADQAQHDLGQGPTVTCIDEGVIVRCSDLVRDPRWPELAGRASALGVSSILSVHLLVGGRGRGALSLYSPLVAAFTDHDEQVGLLLADHAVISVTNALEIHHLHQALTNRDRIGQAKGILMARHSLTADEAFDVLVRSSQDQNRKLADIADEVARTGTTVGLGAA